MAEIFVVRMISSWRRLSAKCRVLILSLFVSTVGNLSPRGVQEGCLEVELEPIGKRKIEGEKDAKRGRKQRDSMAGMAGVAGEIEERRKGEKYAFLVSAHFSAFMFV